MTPEEITAINIQCAERLGIQTQMFRYLIPYHGGKQVWRDGYKTREEADRSRSLDGEWVLSEVEEYTETRNYPNFYTAYDNAAELLVEKARGWGWNFIMESRPQGNFQAHAWNAAKIGWPTSAEAPTLSAAICLAFLKLPIPTL